MKMPYNTLITILLLFFIQQQTIHGQTGYWQFKEVIYGNHFGSQRPPDKLEIDVNAGLVEFSMPQKNNCMDKYRLTFRFLQDMHVLELPIDHTNQPEYAYEFELVPLTVPCYDPEEIGYSNPSVRITHWNATSGLLGNLKKDKSWNYRYHRQFIDEGSVDFYPYKTEVYKNTGKGTGKFIVTGPNKADVEYNLKNYPGLCTDFRILFRGQSTSSSEEAFYFDILFIYELVGGEAVDINDPCSITQPDCSRFPGTIPIWNFATGQGDCICPEGEVWDKIQNRCISNK